MVTLGGENLFVYVKHTTLQNTARSSEFQTFDQIKDILRLNVFKAGVSGCAIVAVPSITLRYRRAETFRKYEKLLCKKSRVR